MQLKWGYFLENAFGLSIFFLCRERTYFRMPNSFFDHSGKILEKLPLCGMPTLSRKKLHHQLENVRTFQNPKLEFEQYCTSAQVAGIDMAFLRAALSIAHLHVYSLHKTTTRNHVLHTIQSTGAQGKVVAELRYDLPRLYKRHRYNTVDIAVDLVHSWF
uniref:Methyltransferase-like protein 5 n=1 Tax=Schistosoma haematobium TaxID=6185 RepID=A0A094ZS99_SCHHA